MQVYTTNHDDSTEVSSYVQELEAKLERESAIKGIRTILTNEDNIDRIAKQLGPDATKEKIVAFVNSVLFESTEPSEDVMYKSLLEEVISTECYLDIWAATRKAAYEAYHEKCYSLVNIEFSGHKPLSEAELVALTGLSRGAYRGNMLNHAYFQPAIDKLLELESIKGVKLDISMLNTCAFSLKFTISGHTCSHSENQSAEETDSANGQASSNREPAANTSHQEEVTPSFLSTLLSTVSNAFYHFYILAKNTILYFLGYDEIDTTQRESTSSADIVKGTAAQPAHMKEKAQKSSPALQRSSNLA